MLRLLLPFSFAFLLFSACDDTPETNAPSEDTEEVADDAANSGDATPDSSEEDTQAPEGDAIEPDASLEEPVWPYPDGPYGTNYPDIIANLSFYDPIADKDRSLAEYYAEYEADGSASVILIVSGAGWCPACKLEAWELIDAYEAYRDQGLRIYYTLFEDHRGAPLFQKNATQAELDQDLKFFNSWITSTGRDVGLPARAVNYPTLVDRDFVLSNYYNADATPLSLIIRTRDMRIIYRETGYSAGTIDQIIRTNLR